MKTKGVIVIQKRFGLELVYEGNTMHTLESGIGTGGTMIPRVAYEEDDEAMGIRQDGKTEVGGRVSNLQGTEGHEHVERERYRGGGLRANELIVEMEDEQGAESCSAAE